MQRRGYGLGLALLWILGGSGAEAQRLQFFECAHAYFYEEECQEARQRLPVLSTPPPEQRPLFTRDTVARDTPETLLTLMNDRTDANAQAYLQEQARRKQAIQEVIQLLNRNQDTPR